MGWESPREGGRSPCPNRSAENCWPLHRCGFGNRLPCISCGPARRCSGVQRKCSRWRKSRDYSWNVSRSPTRRSRSLRPGVETLLQPRPDGVREVVWDGETVGDWAQELEEVEAVINMCGKSANCRYTMKNRKLLIESRTRPTWAVGQAIAQCKVPPQVWVNARDRAVPCVWEKETCCDKPNKFLSSRSIASFLAGFQPRLREKAHGRRKHVNLEQKLKLQPFNG